MKKISAFTLVLLFAVSGFSAAQTGPTFPLRGVQIIDQFLTDPANQTLAKGSDDQRRALTQAIAEQMRFDMGNWSLKSADSGRPQSKDSLAFPVGTNGAFCNFDWQNGATRLRAIDTTTRGELLTDQHLLPTVAVDHLGSPAPTPPTPPVPDTAVAELRAKLESVSAAVVQLRGLVEQLSGQFKEASVEMIQAETTANTALDATTRIDEYLGSRPIPKGCKTGGALGGLVSCRLE